jgi:multiple sugar transport system substrate-binding protein
MSGKKLDRREFLKCAAATSAGLVLASCAPAPAQPPAALAQPTAVPPTAVPPTAVPPTAVPVKPTVAPTAAKSSVTLNVLVQPRDEWQVAEKWIPEFTDKTGIKVVLNYFAENERRSKSRLDASTGAGQYQVYYIDEANVAEFAANKWLLPIKDLYPKEYDFSGFSEPLVNVLTIGGVAYGAPITTEGDMQFWRTDLLQAANITPPTTLDDYLAAVRKLNNPPTLYGTGTRGLRGSGMNVWRFSPYLKMFGGSYLDDAGNPVFNSPEAVKAVEYYIELIKNSPSPTMSWSDVMDAFAAGKVAMVNFANLKMDYLQNRDKSKIIGKMGFSKPSAGPKGSISNASVHGLGISATGNKTDELKAASGQFIGWWTSAAFELRKVKAGFGLTNARTATFASPEFAALYPPEFVKAQAEVMKVQQMCILQIPQWGEIGDYLGVKLEELFTKAYAKQSYDVKAALDDAVKYAATALAKK